MKRVAALYLPEWPIERLWRAEPTLAPPPERDAPSLAPPRAARDGVARATIAALGAQVAEEARVACSVPRGGGWRPGARWAQPGAAPTASPRPAKHEFGRRDEAAGNPFRPMPSDEVGKSSPGGGVRGRHERALQTRPAGPVGPPAA